MNECFNNLVGIKGGCNSNTTATLFLDMIGLTLQQLNDVIQSPYTDGQHLIDDKIDLSTQIIINQIKTHISDKLKTNSIIEGENIGYPYDNLTLIAGETNKLKGVFVELCNDNNFVSIFISDLTLQCDETGQVSVFVYDLIQNKLLDTVVVDAVDGHQVQVNINKTYNSNRKKLHLFIGYDSTSINSYQTTVNRNACTTCSGSKLVRINQYLNVQGASISVSSSKIYNNLSFNNDTAGISFNYTIQCNHEAWLCTLSNRLALPIFFKTAAELYHYGVISQRTNDTTLVNIDKWEKQNEDMEFRYREAIDNILKTIKLPTDNICFECKEKSRNVIILP